MHPLRTMQLALVTGLLLGVLCSAGCREKSSKQEGGKKVIVLGFDGMDPRLCQEMFERGQLPNLKKLADSGSFKSLGTSTPPHSPVAWSNVITGMNPGGHGIFDWIHRDPATYSPEYCTAQTSRGGMQLPLGKWRFPITGAEVKSVRSGKPFWAYLTEAGVNAHIYRMPANYPPEEASGPGEYLALTDMGTPDLRGSLGEFTLYATGAFNVGRDIAGGKAYRLNIRRDVARGSFYGPPDSLLDPELEEAKKPIEVPFTLFRDPDLEQIYLKWDDEHVLLREGEWSGWHEVRFPFGPGVAGTHVEEMVGEVRFYLKQVRPSIQLYVSPIQVDPLEPALPISYPDEFAAEVAEKIGCYYTQGLPEDTQALRADILTRDDFLEQARIIYGERLKLFDYALDRFNDGLLFFYVGSTDQVAHMFWAVMADSHPAITDEDRQKYADVMYDIYADVDKLVGRVMERYPDATIMVISDHGFSNFSRGFNVNTWLVQEGYAARREGYPLDAPMNIDWSKSQAYAIGINAVYLNEVGREGEGIVPQSRRDELLAEITEKLLALRDPQTGEPVILDVYRSDDIFTGSRLREAPDLILGYNVGYRGSWDTPLGGAPKELLVDNTDDWCSDHCIAPRLVPGVVFANRKITLDDPDLTDIAPTVMSQWGIPKPKNMIGQNMFGGEDRPKADGKNN